MGIMASRPCNELCKSKNLRVNPNKLVVRTLPSLSVGRVLCWFILKRTIYAKGAKKEGLFSRALPP